MASLKNAVKLDFTESVPGFKHLKKFDQDSIDLIRANADSKVAVIIDRGYALPQESPYIVLDHLNLQGNNPMVGPNPSCGERFPVVNNIYLKVEDALDPKKTMPLTNPLNSFPSGVAAGVKDGLKLSKEDLEVVRSLGGDFYCYNIIPAMIVAAHAGLKVFAIAVPENESLDANTIKFLKGE